MQRKEGIELSSIVKKAKALFPKNNFPIHHIFMEVLYRYCTPEKTDITRPQITQIAKMMGSEFVSLVEKIDAGDSSHEIFDLSLKLKVRAKKLKSTIGEEFSAEQNSVELSDTIEIYKAAFEKEEHSLKQEVEMLKANAIEKSKQKVEKLFKQMEQDRAKEKIQYLKRFRDFPEFDITRIKIGSYAAKILTKLQNCVAEEQDFFWLESKGFATTQVTEARHKFYLTRAKEHLTKWQSDNVPWSLVNAIADFRKGNSLQEILGEIESNYPFEFSKNNKKLNAALLTTAGGAYRDLHRYNDAIKLGEEANKLVPNEYRPCTLIGASNILLGNISEGHAWYEKAIERGFKPESYENELRSIYFRSSQRIQQELKVDLIARGSNYSWLKR